MFFHILDGIMGPVIRALEKSLPPCARCGGKAEWRENPKLFLIPVSLDGAYEPTAEYYLLNCEPVGGLSQIPTGRRVCRLLEFVCLSCGQRQILAEDFLRVRDTEVLKMRTLFEDGELDELLRTN